MDDPTCLTEFNLLDPNEEYEDEKSSGFWSKVFKKNNDATRPSKLSENNNVASSQSATDSVSNGTYQDQPRDDANSQGGTHASGTIATISGSVGSAAHHRSAPVNRLNRVPQSSPNVQVLAYGTQPVPTQNDSEGDSTASGQQVTTPIENMRHRIASLLNFPPNATGQSPLQPRAIPAAGGPLGSRTVSSPRQLKNYDASAFRQSWMPDERGHQCYECGDRFTTFRRRHHCRICGQIFCSTCCYMTIPGHLLGYAGQLRMCTYCSAAVVSFLDDTSGHGPVIATAHRGTSNESLNSIGSTSRVARLREGLRKGLTTKKRPSFNPSQIRIMPSDRTSQVSLRHAKSTASEHRYSVINADGRSINQDGNAAVSSNFYRDRDYNSPSSGASLQRNERDSATPDWTSPSSRKVSETRTPRQAIPGKGPLETDVDVLSTDEEIASPMYDDDDEPDWFREIKGNNEDEEYDASFEELDQQDSIKKQRPTTIDHRTSSTTSSRSFEVDINSLSGTVHISPAATRRRKTTLADIRGLPSNDPPFLVGSYSDKPITPVGGLVEADQFHGRSEEHLFSRRTNQPEMILNPAKLGKVKQVAFALGDEHRIIRESSSLGSSPVASEFVPRMEHFNGPEAEGTLGEGSDFEDSKRSVSPPASSLESAFINQWKGWLKYAVTSSDLNVDEWFEVLWPLARQIAFTVRPNVRHQKDDLDIRTYIHIKTLLRKHQTSPTGKTGQKSIPATEQHGSDLSTQVIFGTLCTKAVAYSHMRQSIRKPRILIISSSIEYERVPGKFISMDPVIEQETAYLRAAVRKIVDARPNLVIVGRTVSHIAQELLREENITLLFNVKPKVIGRIARCTNAEIVTSVDALIKQPQLGTCGHFHCEPYELYVDQSTGGLESCHKIKCISMFEDCRPDLACGVLLISSVAAEAPAVSEDLTNMKLKSAKRVLKTFIGILYSGKLEMELLNAYGAIVPETNSALTDNNSNSANDTHNNSENSNQCNICVSYHEMSASENVDDIEKEDEAPRDAFATVLSQNNMLFPSPFITICLPYLESVNGRNCKLRKFFKPKIYTLPSREPTDKVRDAESPTTFQCSLTPGTFEHLKIETLTDQSTSPTLSPDETADSSNKPTTLIHDFLTTKLTKPAGHETVEASISSFRAQSARMFRSGPVFQQHSSSSRIRRTPFKHLRNSIQRATTQGHSDALAMSANVLNPFHHQRIAVLFSSFSASSSNAPEFCINPWVVSMVFYGQNDVTFGDFLERYCFSRAYVCPSTTCDAPMTAHVRKVAHGFAVVEITVQEGPEFAGKAGDPPIGAPSEIVAWTWCTHCKATTPSKEMSYNLWHLSFAKFLQYLFVGSTLHAETLDGSCAHCIFHNHVHFFSLANFIATFKVTRITPYDISFPQRDCAIHPMLVHLESCARATAEVSQLVNTVLDNVESQTPIVSKDASVSNKVASCVSQLTNTYVSGRDQLHNMITQLKDALNALHLHCNARLTSHRNENGNGNSEITFDDDTKLTVESFIAEYQQFESILLHTKRSIVLMTQQWNDIVIDYQKLIKQKNVSGDEKPGRLLAPETSTLLEDMGMTKPTEHTQLSLATYDDSPAATKIPQNFKSLASSSSPAKQDPADHPTQSVSPNNGQQPTTPSPSKQSSIPVQSIPYPFGANEHYGQPVGRFPVAINDDEISSIIAYALNSDKYYETLGEARKTFLAQNVVISLKKSLHEHGDQGSSGAASSMKQSTNVNTEGTTATVTLESVSSSPAKGETSGGQVTFSQFLNSHTGASAQNSTTGSSDPSTAQSQPIYHIELQFSDNTSTYYCKILFAEHFRLLRKLLLTENDKTADGDPSVGGEAAFIRSLSFCDTWEPKGGKSGATFFKTKDDRFLLKQMSRFEQASFIRFASNYFHYVSSAVSEGKLTTLAKIYGVFRIGFVNKTTGAEKKLNVLVMENLFYRRRVSRIFDLKGSMRNRLVTGGGSATDKLFKSSNHSGNLGSGLAKAAGQYSAPDMVLLDENFLKMATSPNPLYIFPHSKTALNLALGNDSHFLSSNLIMDYSLLVAVDEDSRELIVGIIDYIRTYTWDKRLETWVKSVGVHGTLPTVISPELYCSRFCEAMDIYFQVAPDQWSGLANGIFY